MQEDYKLYVHIAPNTKKYFGITGVDCHKRWGSNGRGYFSNKHFKNAILKYGWDNFQHIIIADHLPKEWALAIEKFLIHNYKTSIPKYGYNNSTGGDNGGSGYHFHHSLETRLYLGELKRGVALTDSHKQALKNAWKRRKESGKGNAWNKGLPLKETGMLDNFILAGKQNSEKQKIPIQQIDLNTGEVLNEFNSITEAANFLGKDYCSSIIEVAKGNRKSAFGYSWRYVKKGE